MEPATTGDDRIALPPAPDHHPLIVQYLANGGDLAQAKDLFDFVVAVDREKAARAFHEAMNRCQTRMPAVLHDSQNSHLRSTYVSLEGMQTQIKTVYTEEGFSLSWAEDVGARDNYVRIICDVMHKAGHTKRYHGDYPLDGTGAKGGAIMNALQGRVSSNTYAQRDLLRSIFNITIAGTDQDGNNPNLPLSPEQIEIIHELIDKKKALKLAHDHKTFLGIWGVPNGNTGDIPQTQFAPAVRMLNKQLPPDAQYQLKGSGK